MLRSSVKNNEKRKSVWWTHNKLSLFACFSKRLCSRTLCDFFLMCLLRSSEGQLLLHRSDQPEAPETLRPLPTTPTTRSFISFAYGAFKTLSHGQDVSLRTCIEKKQFSIKLTLISKMTGDMKGKHYTSLALCCGYRGSSLARCDLDTQSL